VGHKRVERHLDRVAGLRSFAVGIAVLRYRLYEIDRLISRTLVYASLTVVLGLGYAGVVLVPGQLFGAVAGNPPSWAVAGATLPWPRCSSPPGVASKRSSTGASTGAATTWARRSRQSPSGLAQVAMRR